MNSEQPAILVQGQQFSLVHLDEYGFSAALPINEATRSSGTLQLRDKSLDVEFRVRDKSDSVAICSFANLSLASAEAIKKYLVQRERGFVSGLESRSYDDLAEGIVDDYQDRQSNGQSGAIDMTSADKAFASLTDTDAGSNAVANPSPASSVDPASLQRNASESQSEPVATHREKMTRRSSNVTAPKKEKAESGKAQSGVKSLAMLLTLLAMIGLAVLASYFLWPRSEMSVSNSTWAGNYLPLNAKVDGEIVELLVNEGDTVKKGQVLLRLKNPMMQMEMEHCEASLRTASAKVKTIKKQLINFDQKLEVAAKKLALDLEIAQSEQISTLRMLNSAKASVDMLAPAVAKGAVSRAEFSAVESEYLAIGAALTAANNSVKQIQFSQSAIKDKVLIMGDRVDDGMGRLTAELEIAQAELKQAELASQIVKTRFESLVMKSPRDGRIHVTYRQVGEFVKVADETVAISF
jgi:membrane fusion protein (multidrug efflux system)